MTIAAFSAGEAYRGVLRQVRGLSIFVRQFLRPSRLLKASEVHAAPEASEETVDSQQDQTQNQVENGKLVVKHRDGVSIRHCDRICYPILGGPADSEGWTPVMRASLAGDSHAAFKLLVNGHTALQIICCGDEPLLNGSTPLHLAAAASPEVFKEGSQGYNEVLHVLMSFGANPFLENASGITPFDMALSLPNNQNARAMAQMATFAGTFEASIPGDWRTYKYPRQLYIIPRFQYDSRCENMSGQISVDIVAYGMSFLTEPAFIISLQDASVNSVPLHMGDTDEECSSAAELSFYDERATIPDLITKKGPRLNEHILRLEAMPDGPQTAVEVLHNFCNAVKDMQKILQQQNHKAMYDKMVAGAEVMHVEGGSIIGEAARARLKRLDAQFEPTDHYKRHEVDPNYKLTIIKAPKRITALPQAATPGTKDLQEQLDTSPSSTITSDPAQKLGNFSAGNPNGLDSAARAKPNPPVPKIPADLSTADMKSPLLTEITEAKLTVDLHRQKLTSVHNNHEQTDAQPKEKIPAYFAVEQQAANAMTSAANLQQKVDYDVTLAEGKVESSTEPDEDSKRWTFPGLTAFIGTVKEIREEKRLEKIQKKLKQEKQKLKSARSGKDKDERRRSNQSSGSERANDAKDKECCCPWWPFTKLTRTGSKGKGDVDLQLNEPNIAKSGKLLASQASKEKAKPTANGKRTLKPEAYGCELVEQSSSDEQASDVDEADGSKILLDALGERALQLLQKHQKLREHQPSDPGMEQLALVNAAKEALGWRLKLARDLLMLFGQPTSSKDPHRFDYAAIAAFRRDTEALLQQILDHGMLELKNRQDKLLRNVMKGKFSAAQKPQALMF